MICSLFTRLVSTFSCMYMLIIVEIIDIVFFIRREALYKEEDTRGIYTPDGCSECLFYVRLSRILNFQTLLLQDSTSLVTWSRNIVIDLQSPDMYCGHGQRQQASGSGKNKRNLEFWHVSPGQICIFMYKRKLEYRGVVLDICTFVCMYIKDFFDTCTLTGHIRAYYFWIITFMI